MLALQVCVIYPALGLLQSNSPRCMASSQFVSYSSVHMHLCCFKFSANKNKAAWYICLQVTYQYLFFSKMFLTETDLANVALLFLFCIEDYFWQFLLLLIFYFLWCCYALLHLPEHCEWIFENPWKKTFSWKFKTEFKDLSRMKMRDKKKSFCKHFIFLKTNQ